VRFLFLFENARFYFQPFALTICLLSVFYASFFAICQADMKKIIAYSSVAHMNFALLGFFSNNLYGMLGGMCLMISHGIVSSALFLLIGVLYDRYRDRNIFNYGGLVQVMPLYITFLFIFIISNFSYPGTSNFVGEVLVLIGLSLGASNIILLLAIISTFFGLIYSMLFYNKLAYGSIRLPNMKVIYDVSRREYNLLAPLVSANFIFGVLPTMFLTTLYFSIKRLVLPQMIDGTRLTHDSELFAEVLYTRSAEEATALLMFEKHCISLINVEAAKKTSEELLHELMMSVAPSNETPECAFNAYIVRLALRETFSELLALEHLDNYDSKEHEDETSDELWKKLCNEPDLTPEESDLQWFYLLLLKRSKYFLDMNVHEEASEEDRLSLFRQYMDYADGAFLHYKNTLYREPLLRALEQ
jgi:NADH:ubiquinone oxidoreductase subunit 5 (subunit L)/multisubunit Na+/H+ antiporter MnhA subunit